jgi:hypothetical protein
MILLQKSSKKTLSAQQRKPPSKSPPLPTPQWIFPIDSGINVYSQNDAAVLQAILNKELIFGKILKSYHFITH